MVANGMGERVLTGRVVSVNEKGLKFEGAGEWCNVSKFATGVSLPERGATVTVTLDKAGFIRACVNADGSTVAPATNGHVRVAQSASAPSERDRTITRLAVLKAAAEYAASKQASTSSDVLKIAEAWERWVNRPADELDLEEAF